MTMQQQGGMFGPTPDELRYAMLQQQRQSDMEAAQKWGGMGLGQQISTAAYASGQGIGRGFQQLGEATGYLPQDPRLAEAQKMMEIKKKIMESGLDPEDIDNFYPALIRELANGGMIDKATQLQKEYQTLSTQQEALKEKRREQLMPGLQYIKPLLKGLENKPENAKVLAAYRASITPENPTGDLSLLAELESRAVGAKIKHVGEDGPTGLPAYQLEDGSEPAFYRDPKTGEKKLVLSGLRPKNSVTVGGTTLKLPQKATDLVTDYNKGAEPYIKQFDNAQRAQELIREATQSNNSQTWEAARTTIARAVGQDKLSNEDIRRTGTDPRLVQGAMDWFNKKISGVPTQDIMSQLFVLAKILEKDAKKRGDRYTDQVRTAVRVENPDFKDVDKLFPYMGVNPATTGTRRSDEDLLRQYGTNAGTPTR